MDVQILKWRERNIQISFVIANFFSTKKLDHMSYEIGKSEKSKSMVFEAILSSPGMNEKCKINLSLSRQNILLFCRLIEAGLLAENRNFDDEILTVLPEGSLDELRLVHEEILKKSDLTEFYEKLKLLK